jgi:hypothetical protein
MKTLIIRRPTRLLSIVGILALTAASTLARPVPADARQSSPGRTTTSPVYWGDAIVGSSILVRTPNGISFTYHTGGLPAGYVVTLWIVVFNNPAACFTHPCTDADIFSNPEVQADFLRGAGHVIGGSGIGNFGGHLAVGDIAGSGLAEIGGTAVGLLDPMKAEIQMSIHSHGPAVPGPTLKAQLSSFLGGCQVLLDEVSFPDEVGECVTFQSSIHQ